MDTLRLRIVREGSLPFTRIGTLALVVFAFSASVALAQTQTQTGQTPPLPMPTPAAQSAVQPAAPLPTGAKIAFINLQLVFSESELGKAGQARWKVLNDKLFANLSARDKEIQGLSDKIKTQQTVAGEAVVAAWNQDLARLQREAQFARQEAQVQSDQLQQEVLAEFSKKVQPVIDALRVEKGLQAIVGVQNDGSGMALLSSDPGLDLSAELIKRLNAQK
jgi:Skp family chaperone for outer membrane proteins